jgi:hypothetical protein
MVSNISIHPVKHQTKIKVAQGQANGEWSQNFKLQTSNFKKASSSKLQTRQRLSTGMGFEA